MASAMPRVLRAHTLPTLQVEHGNTAFIQLGHVASAKRSKQQCEVDNQDWRLQSAEVQASRHE
jgi:hypothetical protein